MLLLLACTAADPCTSGKGCLDTGAVDSGRDTSPDSGDTGDSADSSDTADSSDIAATSSAGCGLPSSLRPGGVQVSLDAGADGGGTRGYWLSLPAGYDPAHTYPVVFGFPGTDWVGEQIQPYLDLESHADEPMIFVYPDPLWRTFEGWGTYGGWVLGPYAAPADGMEDLVFTGAILDELEASYCVNPSRVYVTGHSWGGDMAAVVGCFLGDRFRAAAPAAANEPYWFDTTDRAFACTGATAVWTWFGLGDDHFTWQDYPGQFGEAQDDFWADTHACAGVAQVDVAGGGTCSVHDGCTADTRICLYPEATGHQIPPAFPRETMAWFEGMR